MKPFSFLVTLLKLEDEKSIAALVFLFTVGKRLLFHGASNITLAVQCHVSAKSRIGVLFCKG